MDGRKELKFLLGEKELFLIESKIRSILQKDAHQTGDSYLIRSVYFDSPDRTCFRENAAGVDRRRKYRIRTYDCDDSLIRAEIKTKYRDTTHKDSVALTREQYEAMVFKAGSMQPHSLDSLTGTFARERVAISPADEVQELATERVAISPADSARDFDWECCCISPAQKAQQEFTYRILAEGYRPSCIVEYERSAYCYEPCNVRVTFDRNIRAAGDFDRFFEKDLPTVPACEAGKHILEVKYDEFLPEFLLQILQTGSLRRTSFSKFYRAELALRP